MDKDKKSVLIVDDSALVRKLLSEIIEADPKLHVVGTAPDAIIAARKIQRLKPDVITLDIEMPRMDGLTFLEKLMSQRPMPVVVISSLTQRGAEVTLKAFERGAVEVVAKPTHDISHTLVEQAERICQAVKAAAQARIKKRTRAPRAPDPKLSVDVVLPKKRFSASWGPTDNVVVMGASTGGTEALTAILKGLTPWCPGIAVVQHMPEKFTKVFAERLNGVCAMEVKEAVSGDELVQGRVLIAPGDRHMVLLRKAGGYSLSVIDGPLVNRHRPSVDVLFRSAVTAAGENAVGVLLTGMGDDGARGLKELKEAGSYTIAQDENTCVVFGMPKEAIRLEAASTVLPLHRIAGELMERTGTAASKQVATEAG